MGDDIFDSKPILAVAYGKQHPQLGPLSPSDFSGGSASTVRALARLGFDVVTRAQLDPPNPGDEFESRTAIYGAFGGDRVSGIVRFPGEEIVNLFADAQGPYADDPPQLTGAFGYRGEGLRGPQSVTTGGNALLERARAHQAAARFWYRPPGGPFTFQTWVAVLGRVRVSGVGSDGVARPELEWQLEAVHGPSPTVWSSAVKTVLRETKSSKDDDVNAPEASPYATYNELVTRVEERGQARRSTGAVRTDYARSAAARRAVLLRCIGRCENVRCTGMPPDRTRRGLPILDVDHVLDLALKGEDHPRNMIALCPNCHAAKTRGSEWVRWRRELALVAKAAHIAASERREPPTALA